jgi:hypothetical protein
MFGLLPRDISTAIVTIDPQTWRAMRRVTTYYHQLLSWSAYVDKFTVVNIKSRNITYDGNTCTTTWTTRTWSLDGLLHREHDLPAVVHPDGAREWHRYGQLHREHDKPARLYRNGTIAWSTLNRWNRRHDRPASISTKGRRGWIQNGLIHRCHDRPALVRESGTLEWFQHGYRRRAHDPPCHVLAIYPASSISWL